MPGFAFFKLPLDEVVWVEAGVEAVEVGQLSPPNHFPQVLFTIDRGTEVLFVRVFIRPNDNITAFIFLPTQADLAAPW